MSEQLPDIYISKECINDWGFDKPVTDKAIFKHYHYTPHAKLKEAEDINKQLQAKLDRIQEIVNEQALDEGKEEERENARVIIDKLIEAINDLDLIIDEHRDLKLAISDAEDY